MYKKMNLNDFLAVLIERVETETGLRCYDAVPLNAPSPFYFAEVVQTAPANTKTSFRDRVTVYFHAIAKPNNSSAEINDLINSLQEALSSDIELPEPYWLALQVDNGVTAINQDETKEKHAILTYDFTISYGLKCK